MIGRFCISVGYIKTQESFNEWLKIQEKNISPNTLRTKASRINNHIMPALKDQDIKKITHAQIAELLKEAGNKTPQTAFILNQILNGVFLFAVSSGYTDFNIMANIDAKSIIPKARAEHYGKLTEADELKAFIDLIYDYPHFVSERNILKFCLHIPLRTKPLAELKWKYIDFEKRILTIPRAEQKVKRKDLGDFKIPLSDEVMAILDEQYRHFRAYYGAKLQNAHTQRHTNKDNPQICPYR